MKLQLTRPMAPGNIISGYGDDHVLVNGERHSGSLLVTADVLLPWDAPCFGALAATHFEAIVALTPDLVLLGTGPRLRFPAATLTQPLARAGIGLEVMDLRAACRTYNVLRAEERRVAAALLFE
ncbi:MAG TPA: Mth938-like domain-containing protein [Burkholderiales bacterium]|nr:Mth938-like domain-containing protein [Burkholderiales bacterium]